MYKTKKIHVSKVRFWINNLGPQCIKYESQGCLRPEICQKLYNQKGYH